MDHSSSKVDSDHPGTEKGAASVAERLRDAALFMLTGHISDREAVAIADNSAAVQKMFPNNRDLQDAAYNILMHDMDFPDYPGISSQNARLLSQGQMAELHKYEREYLPSLKLTEVDEEASRLSALGYPHTEVPGRHRGSDHKS